MLFLSKIFSKAEYSFILYLKRFRELNTLLHNQTLIKENLNEPHIVNKNLAFETTFFILLTFTDVLDTPFTIWNKSKKNNLGFLDRPRGSDDVSLSLFTLMPTDLPDLW